MVVGNCIKVDRLCHNLDKTGIQLWDKAIPFQKKERERDTDDKEDWYDFLIMLVLKRSSIYDLHNVKQPIMQWKVES